MAHSSPSVLCRGGACPRPQFLDLRRSVGASPRPAPSVDAGGRTPLIRHGFAVPPSPPEEGKAFRAAGGRPYMIFSAFAQGRAMRARRFPTSRPYCANLGAPREYSPKRAKAGDPMTEYYIPTQAGEAELVEKRSRFIGPCLACGERGGGPCPHRGDAKSGTTDARHNCWCYLLREGPVRYSDDGEPQGTAGQPMLNVFQREEVTNVCCVVTRYFGGILLGAGGAWSGLILKAPRTPWTPPASRWCAAGWRRWCPVHTAFWSA